MIARYDAIIVGGGFYGLSIALYLYEKLGVKDVLVIEREPAPMTHASYVNQARIHNGYHYPRSLLTGYRSRLNFDRFVTEYKAAVVNNFDKYYGIAKILSKVNSHQFENFCLKIGADFSPASEVINKYFNDNLVESIYKVKEYAFNSHIIRDTLLRRIAKIPSIKLKMGEMVEKIGRDEAGLLVETNKEVYAATRVFNCTYAQLNNIHRKSGLPLLPLKHEIAEMCLVKLPKGMESFSITMMDGPFFSIMPFPTRGLHTLSHVRYTPHTSWLDNESTSPERHDAYDYKESLDISTNYKKMYSDVVRFIPALKDMDLVDTISDVKTVLVKSEQDDSRPILFNSSFGLDGYTCIMGGKLDNIYDVFEELDLTYEATK